jgi:hypothetical protein
MLALTIYEDGLCKCGQPVILAHHEDNDGWYTAHATQCHSCAARERASKPTKGAEPTPGQQWYTTYDRPADKPLKRA